MAQTLEELKAEGLTLEVLELFPRQGKWTERYYFSLPETNKIVELSSGWGTGEVAHSKVLAGFQVAVDDVFGI